MSDDPRVIGSTLDELNWTIVVVTHGTIVASIGDSALFLTDGRVIRCRGRAQRRVLLDRMKSFGVLRC